jgi:hypothetical protein
MGMRKLFFGLESASQATLDHMDKGIRVDDARVVLRNCADAGVAFHLFSIIGFPEETEARARETAQFFVDNAAVIDAPRNSFDIHPFSLDLRTDYADQSATFGVEIDGLDSDRARQDFPLTVEGWRNTRGLGRAEVDDLLDEFHSQLRATYRAYHQYPLTLWPGYEEYTVLYGDHYDRRPFPFRLTLPSSDDGTPIRLIWSEDVRIKQSNGGYVVDGPFGTVVIGENALALLARPASPQPVDDLLFNLAAPLLGHGRDRQDVLSELRTVIDWLLGSGALRLVLPVAEVVA